MSDVHKILIVDDDQKIRDLLVGRLKTYGFAAIAVDCGKSMTEELAFGGYNSRNMATSLPLPERASAKLRLIKPIRQNIRRYSRTKPALII